MLRDLPPPIQRALRTFGPALGVLAVQQLVWPVKIGWLVSGLILGGLGSLGALSLALVWRSSRVVNFAAGDLGTLPVTFVLLAAEVWKLPYAVTLGLGVVSAVVVGILAELLIIRRFSKSSRLTLTVATIGLGQLLTFGALSLPSLFNRVPKTLDLEAPFELTFTIGAVVFSANDVMAAIVSVVAIVALVWFLKKTDTGVAIRAAAESSDRAAMLGIPVARLGTIVWAIASLLGFATVFFSAGINGLPTQLGTSFEVLLLALAALVMGRMTDLVCIATSSVSLGILAASIRANSDDSLLMPLLLGVIVIALLLQRSSTARVDDSGASAWSQVEVRPVPEALLALPLVRAVRWGGALAIAAIALAFPYVGDTGVTLKGGAILIFATVGVSIVILTGWAGQVSLAQMTFVGIGGAAAAWAIQTRGLDPLIGMVLAAVVGAVVAVIVGLPALRLRGLYLAVVTLGMSLAASAALFTLDVIPSGSFKPTPVILGRISLDSASNRYYLALAVLVLAALTATAVRRSRTGRVLVALRENERAAVSYGVSAVRVKLTGFALSGAIAALAGATYVLQVSSFRAESYEAGASVAVFVTAVIGGISTVTGAIVGAIYLRGAQWILPGNWQILASSVGVLAILMVLPDGLGGVIFKIRDAGLRAIARRTGTEAPGLLSVAEHDVLAAQAAPKNSGSEQAA